jgi:hypothetical protein
MDKDGYPEESELEKIRNWKDFNDGFIGFLEYVRSLWTYHEFVKTNNGSYIFITGGWSGNEELIRAMQSNHTFWLFCWQSSNRGGKHVFTTS